ncbi:MAG: sulfite exporter TauE/SafE family protein, partial [Deltaproteobacteria bacterium]
MKKVSFVLTALTVGIALMMAVPNTTLAAAKISASEYKVGDTVTIEGSIQPGKDLYVTVVSQTTFAPQDTDGVHEVARLKREAKKR